MLNELETDVSDAALVMSARGGNEDAFCRLLDRHRSLLFALCARTLGDPALAEDAVQEAVLQALLSLDHLRRPDRFGSWLAGIGLNVCRSLLRERSRDCWSWEAVHGGRAIEPADWQPGPEELAEAADLADRIRRAVAILPRGQRLAVMLFYLSGLTYSETADLLGIEISSVKSRLHKARGALREQLWASWKEDEMAARADTDAVEVRIADVRRAPVEGDATRYHILIIEEIGGTRRLPIWVGQAEGTAIALQLEKVQVPRPLTFSFMANLLEASRARLREVRINKLAEGTFYAVAVIEGSQGAKSVDARPSDALALALVTAARVLVEPSVFDAADSWAAAHPEAQRDLPAGTGAREIVQEVTSRWPGYGAGGSRSR